MKVRNASQVSVQNCFHAVENISLHTVMYKSSSSGIYNIRRHFCCSERQSQVQAQACAGDTLSSDEPAVDWGADLEESEDEPAVKESEDEPAVEESEDEPAVEESEDEPSVDWDANLEESDVEDLAECRCVLIA